MITNPSLGHSKLSRGRLVTAVLVVVGLCAGGYIALSFGGERSDPVDDVVVSTIVAPVDPVRVTVLAVETVPVVQTVVVTATPSPTPSVPYGYIEVCVRVSGASGMWLDGAGLVDGECRLLRFGEYLLAVR